MKTLVELILKLGNAEWVVDSEGSPGFRLFGKYVMYYKWNDVFVVLSKENDCGLTFRPANKREITTIGRG